MCARSRFLSFAKTKPLSGSEERDIRRTQPGIDSRVRRNESDGTRVTGEVVDQEEKVNRGRWAPGAATGNPGRRHRRARRIQDSEFRIQNSGVRIRKRRLNSAQPIGLRFPAVRRRLPGPQNLSQCGFLNGSIACSSGTVGRRSSCKRQEWLWYRRRALGHRGLADGRFIIDAHGGNHVR